MTLSNSRQNEENVLSKRISKIFCPRMEGVGHSPMMQAIQNHQFTVVIILLQILFLVLMGIFGRFEKAEMDPDGAKTKDELSLDGLYPMFTDTHIMIFIGFGFLMTFLRKYAFSAVSINLLLAAFTLQWGLIIRGFLSENFAEERYFYIDVLQLVRADFAAAVILISMGAMLGKLSPVQYLIMSFFEVPAALVIEWVINDVGGSIVIHTFGAYFGLACAVTFGKKAHFKHKNEGSAYHNDVFAMIGTIFLWCFWPSFNAATASTLDSRQRSMVNTVLSLATCTVVTFVISQAVDKHHKFDMVHIENSSLAGAVAIGCSSNIVLQPVHSMLVGCGAAIISVLGYKFLMPFLGRRLRLHDTCGVHNLHGMPGVLAGLLSALFAGTYHPEDYGSTLNLIYPSMKSPTNPNGRTASEQAGFQLLGLACVLGTALVTGALTGILLRLPFINQVDDHFSDTDYFETPDDFEALHKISQVSRDTLDYSDNGSKTLVLQVPAV